MNSKTASSKGIVMVYKLVIFILMLILFDFLIGKAIQYSFSKQDSGALYRTTYSMDSTTAEILIFGSSKANHSYDTRIFRQLMPNLSSYNCGNDGSSIFYHYAVLKTILKRYLPKIIILDFVPGEFRLVPGHYEKLSYLLPFVNNHKEIREIVLLKSRYENIKLLSKVYPYNSLLVSIVGGMLNIHSTGQFADNGYVPLEGEWEADLETYYPGNNELLDSNKIYYFQAFLDECIKADIKLYICSSPGFIDLRNGDKSIVYGKKLAMEREVPYYDYSIDTTFINHRYLFRDIAHLNYLGAEKFTKNLISKKIIPEIASKNNNIMHEDYWK